MPVILPLTALVLGYCQTPADGHAATPSEKTVPDLPHKDFHGVAAWPVVRVCRGDTVIVKIGDEAKRLGLIGVEVPGMAEPPGAAAERFLHNLLAGETVFVEFADTNPVPDRFGCIPAYVFRAPDGLFVNLEMVRQGYATVPEESTFEYRPTFQHFQECAREAHKGRWGPDHVSESQGPDKSSQPNSGSPAGTKSDARDGRHSPATHPNSPAPASQAAAGGSAAASDTIVYISAKGTKYHSEGCRHLRNGGRPITLEEARKRGLTPCSQCKPPG